MKLLVNVTGLKKIVFNQSVVYKLREQNKNKYWERTDGGGDRPNSIVSYAKMCANLWALGLDPKNDTWVHGDTYNAITYAKMITKPIKPKSKKKSKNKGLDFNEQIKKNVIDAIEAVNNRHRNPQEEISFRGKSGTKWKQV